MNPNFPEDDSDEEFNKFLQNALAVLTVQNAYSSSGSASAVTHSSSTFTSSGTFSSPDDNTSYPHLSQPGALPILEEEEEQEAVPRTQPLSSLSVNAPPFSPISHKAVRIASLTEVKQDLPNTREAEKDKEIAELKATLEKERAEFQKQLQDARSEIMNPLIKKIGLLRKEIGLLTQRLNNPSEELARHKRMIGELKQNQAHMHTSNIRLQQENQQLQQQNQLLAAAYQQSQTEKQTSGITLVRTTPIPVPATVTTYPSLLAPPRDVTTPTAYRTSSSSSSSATSSFYQQMTTRAPIPGSSTGTADSASRDTNKFIR